MSLEDLKAQRRKLDRQIAEAERSEAEAKKKSELAAKYVQVACPTCSGSGEYGEQFGSDNTDIMAVDCQDCGGRGYLWGRKWMRLTTHDMEHNQVCVP